MTDSPHKSHDRAAPAGGRLRSLHRGTRRITRGLLWTVLVAMLVSLVVQASAVGMASPADQPVIEQRGPASANPSPVPNIGTSGSSPVAAAPETPDDPAQSLAGSVDVTHDTTFPPVTTTRARESDLLEDGPTSDATTAEEAALLENDARARIHEEVTRSPGISMSEVADRTDIPLSTVRYHTWVLSTEDALDEAKIRGKRRLFPTMMDSERKELTAALADDATARLLAGVGRHEPASVSDLAESLDRSASTVSYHLQRLQDAGLVERERDGGATVTRLHPFVRAELAGAVEADGGPESDAPAPPDGPDDDR